jgi:type I restriction enzyme S subunit
MKLTEVIDSYVSGDWGNEEYSNESPNAVFCVRGADIVPISNHSFNNIPKRYVSDRTIETKLLKEGDLVVEKSGGSPTQSTGRVVYISKDLIENAGSIVCSNFCTAIRVKPEWNPLYVYYYWQNIYNRGVFFNFEGKTSGIKNLQMDIALSAIEIEYLPLEKQNEIVAILSVIDSKITINRQINDNLEAIAKQLYDYWFVQFDFPNEEGKPYKSSGGKMVWNDKLKREIPEGWGDAKIKDIANTYSGGTPTSTNQDYYIGGKIPWINSGELNNPVITETSNYITDLGLNNSSAKLYPQNTILVALYGATAGKVSLLSFEACSNQAVCGVMPTEDNMTTYIRYHLASLYEHFIILSSGSARDNISQDTIKNTILPIPRIEILKKYEDIVKPIVDKIIANQKEVENLTMQRDELLQLLMNGQVSLTYHLSDD